MKKEDKTRIRELIGAASMCWTNPAGAGEFDSIRANEIADEIIEIVEQNGIEPRLERIENYLEAGHLTAHFQHTENRGFECSQKLRKYPKDINAMTLLVKLDNDQKIIEPRMREVNCAIWRHIVAAYGNGRPLKYFEMEAPKRPDLNNEKTTILHVSE